MSLTGIPLIVAVGAAALVALAATIFFWSRGDRRHRLRTRTLGAICVQVFLVATFALIENRDQTFFPSWSDLFKGGQSARIIPVASLQVAEQAAPDLHWLASREQQWQLRAPAALVLPADYASRANVAYSVVVVLCTPTHLAEVRKAAAHLTDTVTIAVSPKATTGAWSGLTVDLPRHVRVTDHDWALVADDQHAALATRLGTTDPHFATKPAKVTHGWATTLKAAADQLPAPLPKLPG